MDDGFEDTFENEEEKNDFEKYYSEYQMKKFEEVNYLLEYKNWMITAFSKDKCAVLPKKFCPFPNMPIFLAALNHVVYPFIMN